MKHNINTIKKLKVKFGCVSDITIIQFDFTQTQLNARDFT